MQHASNNQHTQAYHVEKKESAQNADEQNKNNTTPTTVQLTDQVGLGIDLVGIERIEKILARTPSFAKKVFSEDERAYCDSTTLPATHYATRFAAKEAVLKALGISFSSGVHPRNIEVIRHPNGRPSVKLSGKALSVAQAQHIVDLPISLSFTHSDAVACAMAISKDSLRAKEQRTDSMQELSKQFKKLRGMLDDIQPNQKTPVSNKDTGVNPPSNSDGNSETTGKFADALTATSADIRKSEEM